MNLKRILVTTLTAVATGALLGFGVLAASANQASPSAAPPSITTNAGPQQSAAPDVAESASEAGAETTAEAAGDPAGDPAGGLESQHDHQGQETGEH